MEGPEIYGVAKVELYEFPQVSPLTRRQTPHGAEEVQCLSARSF
jgi:hypothetical protein